MKYYVYTNFNRKVEAYERPIVTFEDPDEYVEHIVRDFKASDENAQAKIREYNVFYRGTYDDNTGCFDFVEPNCILSCAVLGQKAADEAKEVTDNV